MQGDGWARSTASLVAAAAIITVAPASAQSITQQTPRGQDLTAAIGGIVWEKAVYAGERLLTLPAAVRIGTGDEAVSIDAGTPLVVVRPKKLKACLEQQITNLQGVDYFNWHACVIDSDDDGRFDRAAPDDFGAGKPLPAPIAYVRPLAPPNGTAAPPFHWTLTYLGKAGSGFRFAYKVYAEDPLRPKIVEDVTVPAPGALPQTATVKDITLTMLDTGIGGLTYRIDQGSDATD